MWHYASTQWNLNSRLAFPNEKYCLVYADHNQHSTNNGLKY